MNKELEKAKLNLDLKRVQIAREAMEVQIMELESNIERIKENIKIQLDTEKVLEKKILDLNSK